MKYTKLHDDAVAPILTDRGTVFVVSAYLVSPDTKHTVQAILPPRTSKVIPTGLIVTPPPHHCIMVFSRPGLAIAQPPIFMAHSPTIIGSDFTEELKITLFNGGHDSAYIRHGDRIAHFIIIRPELIEDQYGSKPEAAQRTEAIHSGPR